MVKNTFEIDQWKIYNYEGISFWKIEKIVPKINSKINTGIKLFAFTKRYERPLNSNKI